MSEAAAIELQGVTRNFGDVTAVDNVDLRIDSGTFFTVLGPSGCGKSTMLRIVAGLEQPDSGGVLLDGTDITAEPPERRDVSMVFQDYALFPNLDVLHNVMFPLKMRKVPRASARERALAALELVDLHQLQGRRITEMSGGQRQRTALARSLVWNPGALLLDEPLAALDFQLRQEMQLMLKGLQERVGITFMFVTHDQTEAFRLSDRIAVMQDGRLEQVGSPEELYHQPRSLFVATFIGNINTIEGRVESVNADRVTVRCGEERLEGQPAHGKLEIGQHVTVAVRPEHVDWVSEQDAEARGRNRLSCRVQHVGFQGAMVETTARVWGDETWLHVCMIPGGRVAPRPSESARLEWSAADTRIFPVAERNSELPREAAPSPPLGESDDPDTSPDRFSTAVHRNR